MKAGPKRCCADYASCIERGTDRDFRCPICGYTWTDITSFTVEITAGHIQPATDARDSALLADENAGISLHLNRWRDERD